jgi:hypothetical protein
MPDPSSLGYHRNVLELLDFYFYLIYSYIELLTSENGRISDIWPCGGIRTLDANITA